MQGKMQTPEMTAQMYAALILMTIPSIIVYLFSQRWLQAGVTAGSVKS
jgi:raffinose/stachyose/melibiose transport system permease protein